MNSHLRGSIANTRVTRIVQLNRDFQAHINNIHNISTRASQNKKIKKHIQYFDKVIEEKNRYFHNVQGFKLNVQQKENDKIVKRLEQIHKRDPRKLSKSGSNQSLHSIRSLTRQDSAKTLKSLNSSMRRSESKRIFDENHRLAKQIQRVKPDQSFNVDRLSKQFRREQDYVKSISRYSQKNKKILGSIIEKSLAAKHKKSTYLPIITDPTRKHNISPNKHESVMLPPKCLTSRPRK